MVINQTDTNSIDIDYLLYVIGSSRVSDAIGLFLIPIIIIIGITLNIIGFLVLYIDKEFNSNLYLFLKAHFFNSVITNILGILVPFVTAHHYLTQFSNSWFAFMYLNQIAVPIINTAYFYGNILDVWMALDKVGIFSRSVTKFNRGVFKNP